MLISMTSCAALNPESPTASDSFCLAYQRVINNKGDGTISATRSVKNRIAANEKTYVCNCVSPRPALCGP
jgi:hypothetical protein